MFHEKSEIPGIQSQLTDALSSPFGAWVCAFASVLV